MLRVGAMPMPGILMPAGATPMLMFNPIIPGFTGTPTTPMVPVAMEAGMPIAIMGLVDGLMGVMEGGAFRVRPPKPWGRLTGG